MQIFNTRKRASGLALAIGLATGSAVVAAAVFPTEAHAQRKKDKKDKEEDDGGGYSDEFLEAYKPINEGLQAEGADAAAFKPQLEALIPLSKTNDEKIAAGGMVFNTGIKLNDRDMQLQGMELMLASGKVPVEQVGRYNFIAYQLANAQQDFPKARTYLQKAIDNNFATENVSAADLQIAMAESYFSGDEFVAGLDYLASAIKSKKASGDQVEEQWYRRGLTVAYNNEIVPQVYDFAAMWIGDYPSATNWRDAVNLTRNLTEFDQKQMLDLLRLSKVTGAIQDKHDYILYIESADPRRLPNEVQELIEQAYVSDAVSRDDIFVADSLTEAKKRVGDDRADLPSLATDADRADADLRLVVAAGDAFYSYGQYDKAARFYEKALSLPGVNSDEALTRLGMSQIGLGNFAAAQETFAKVSGPRVPIAKLWSAYAAEKAAEATQAATPAATPTDTGMEPAEPTQISS